MIDVESLVPTSHLVRIVDDSGNQGRRSDCHLSMVSYIRIHESGHVFFDIRKELSKAFRR